MMTESHDMLPKNLYFLSFHFGPLKQESRISSVLFASFDIYILNVETWD